MFDLIKTDLARKREMYHHYASSWVVRYLKNAIDPGALAVIIHRFGHWSYNLKLPVVKHLLLLVYTVFKMVILVCFGIFIPVKARIGKGFVIHNFGNIFIPSSTIGENFTVQQGVTIGAVRPNKWKDGVSRPPRIGNNVYIGAGAKILGNVTVGNGAVIGANSVVMNDVPDHCTVMGIPARIISRNQPSEEAYGMPDSG